MKGDVKGIHAGRATALVLIVDDETHNRALLEIMLSSEGYDLLTAASGEEALAVVEEHRPDLILLDIMMPEMNGFEVTTVLKANPATQHIPRTAHRALVAKKLVAANHVDGDGRP